MVEKYHEAMDNFFYIEIYKQILSDWILNDYSRNLSKFVSQPSFVLLNLSTKAQKTTRCHCCPCYRLKKHSPNFYKRYSHDDSCSKWCNTLAISCAQNYFNLLKPILPPLPLHPKTSFCIMSSNKERIPLNCPSCALCQFHLETCTRPFFHRWKQILCYIFFEFFSIHIFSNPFKRTTNAVTQLFFHYLLIIYSIQFFLLFTGTLVKKKLRFFFEKKISSRSLTRNVLLDCFLFSPSYSSVQSFKFLKRKNFIQSMSRQLLLLEHSLRNIGTLIVPKNCVTNGKMTCFFLFSFIQTKLKKQCFIFLDPPIVASLFQLDKDLMYQEKKSSNYSLTLHLIWIPISIPYSCIVQILNIVLKDTLETYHSGNSFEFNVVKESVLNGPFYICRLSVELYFEKTLQRMLNILPCCVCLTPAQSRFSQCKKLICKKQFFKKLRKIPSLHSTEKSVSNSDSAFNDEAISRSASILTLDSCSSLTSKSAPIICSTLATPDNSTSNFTIQSNSILGSSKTLALLKDFALESASTSTSGSIKYSILDSVSASTTALLKDSALDSASSLNLELCSCVTLDTACVSALSTRSLTQPTSVVRSALPPTSVEGSVLPFTSVEESALPPTSLKKSVLPSTSVEGSVSPFTSVKKSALPPTSLEESASPLTSLEESAVPPTSLEELTVPSTSLEGSTLPPTSVERSVLLPTLVEGSLLPPTSAEGSASAPVSSSSSSRKCVGGGENNNYEQEKAYEEVSQDNFFETNHNLAPLGSDGDDNGESHENPSHVVRPFQSQHVSNNQPVIVEFPVKHFWKIAKQQNDLESSEMGRCRGFYYRLLIHPKGTAGTDSEASHLSVFLEAVRQDWFPDDWVFPNVRFELTVVNFRDPKQNVTSWAHWSFSNDAASRGWQKMLSHSRLNRLSGFVDDEGTVLIRGKAEPPYDALWSHASLYRSKNVWVPMNRAFVTNDVISPHYDGSIDNSNNLNKSSTSQKKNVATTPWVDLSQEQIIEHHEKDTEPSSFLFEKNIYLAQHFCDQVVPVLRVVLHADCVAYFLLILYFLKEFRREIFLWSTCHTTPQDESLSLRFEETSNDSRPATLPIIESLQSVFASLQLYPLVQSLRQLSTISDQSKIMAEDTQIYESPLDWWKHHVATASTVSDTMQSILDTPLRQPSAKDVMRALCLADIQKTDVVDPLPSIHTTLFTMLHRQCQITYVTNVYKEALMNAKKQAGGNDSTDDECFSGDHGEETCDAQELDRVLHVLFSTASDEFPRNPVSLGDYATSFVKVKHVHSMYRALEQSGKRFKRLPEILFVYLAPQRNTKKGELFDVPLRLEMSNFLDVTDEPNRNTHTNTHTEEYVPFTGSSPIPKEEEPNYKLLKQKRRKRKQKSRNSNLSDLSIPIEKKSHQQSFLESQHESLGHQKVSSPSSLAEESTTQNCKRDRWYCLYALIIREGDGPFGPVGVSQTSRTLLLRPEEDSPWYRIAQNRVEKLTSKVDFSEWKCHRDFFCSAAVYIAEDYIDAVANGDVDCETNLRDLNPYLYHKTLNDYGFKEEDIQKMLTEHFKTFQNASSTESPRHLTSSVCNNTRISSYDAPETLETGFSDQSFKQSEELFCKSKPFITREEFPAFRTHKKESSQPVLRFSPIGINDEVTDSLCETPNILLPRDIITEKKNETEFSKQSELEKSSLQNSVLMVNKDASISPLFPNCRSLSSSTEGVLKHQFPNDNSACDEERCQSLCSHGRVPWWIYHDEIEIHHFLHQMRLAQAIRSKDVRDIKRTLVYILADQFTLCYYSSLFFSYPMLKSSRCHMRRTNSTVYSHFQHSSAYLRRSSFSDTSKSNKQCYCEKKNAHSEKFSGGIMLQRYRPDVVFKKEKRSLSESRLCKNSAECISSQLFNKFRYPLERQLESMAELFLFFQKEIILKDNNEFLTKERFDQHIETWLQRIWNASVDLVLQTEQILFNHNLDGSESDDLLQELWFKPSFETDSRPKVLKSLRPFCAPRMNQFFSSHHQKNSFKAMYQTTKSSDLKPSLDKSHCDNPKFNGTCNIPWNSRCSDLETPSSAIPRIVCSAIISIIELFSSATRTSLKTKQESFSMPVHNRRYLCKATKDLLQKKTIHEKSADRCKGNILEPIQAKRRRGKINDCRLESFDSMSDGDEHFDVMSLKSDSASKWLSTNMVAYHQPDEHTSEEALWKSGVNASHLSIGHKKINVHIHQQLAYLLDPEDFMAPANAKEFYQARLANFGTLMGHSPSLVSYLRNSSLTTLSGRDMTSIKNLRSLDTLLGGVGLSASFKQLVTAARYVRISISLEEDLFGLEGFACEQEPVVRRVLTGYRGMSTSRLYGLLRLLLLREADDTVSCVWHGKEDDRERKKRSMRTLKLETSWTGTAEDSFMLYALVPDADPSRKGRYRYVYMVADDMIDTYCDAKRRQIDPQAPDLYVLLVMCGHLDGPIGTASCQHELSGSRKTRSHQQATRQTIVSCSSVDTVGKRFPLPDDAQYPLFIFKWFDYISLDLMCVGAKVCDSRKRLEDYVVDWFLPLLTSKGYEQHFPSLKYCDNTKKYDMSRYVIVEECHIRTCQNVRRFNAAIKKINKHTGDVIIVQFKHETCSPCRMMEKISSEVIAQCSTMCHANDVTYAPWMVDVWKSYEKGVCSAHSLIKNNKKLDLTLSNNPLPFNSQFLHVTSHSAQVADNQLESLTQPTLSSSLEKEQVTQPASTLDEELNTDTANGLMVSTSQVSQSKENQGKSLCFRSNPKKKKKTKTSIPAKTKSKMKAQAQEERRKEADRLSCNAEAYDNNILVDDETKVPCSLVKTEGCSLTKESKKENTVRMSKKISESLGVPAPSSFLQSFTTNSVVAEKVVTQSLPKTIQSHTKFTAKTTQLDSLSSRVEHQNDSQNYLSATQQETLSPKKEQLPLETIDSTQSYLPAASTAVLNTFPNGFSTVMENHCLFTFENVQEQTDDTLKPSCVRNGNVTSLGLDNLKVILNPSTNVDLFVNCLLEQALIEIQQVPLEVRLESNTWHKNSTMRFSTSTTSSRQSTNDASHTRRMSQREHGHLGQHRLSHISLNTAYHIDRLLNDYLHDDKHYQEIICTFRKQLETCILHPIPWMDSLVENDTVPHVYDAQVLTSEANLFERSLSSRQLAALELFASVFVSTDLIGTRKGLHSLTLTLLSQTTCTESTKIKRNTSNSGNTSKASSRFVSNNSLSSDGISFMTQHSTALSSLCFLFFILGPKKILTLADSQAGRRHFDNIMTTLSDCLRRLNILAFTDTNSYDSFSNQQLRHAFWALVLFLKDIVASRSPLTATVVSRETEAALTLATLPFLSHEKKSFKNFSDDTTEQMQSSNKKNTVTGKSTDRSLTFSHPAFRTCLKECKTLATPTRHVTSFGRRKAGWTALANTFLTLHEEDDLLEQKQVNSHQSVPSASHAENFKAKDTLNPNLLEIPSETLYSDVSDGYDDEDVLDSKLDDDLLEDEEDISEAFQEHDSGPTITQGNVIVGWTNMNQLKGRKKKFVDPVSGNVVTGAAAKALYRNTLRFDVAKSLDMRQFLDRRTGRPRVNKDKPRIVHESPTWFVTYKPAFWHCSGPSHCVDRPLDLQRLKKGDIEKTLQHISLFDLLNSGKMESFHLWLMKQFPHQETIKRWTELECGLCHRIDLETSGAVLIARTRRTRDFLWDQFRRRNVHKEYLLLCHGRIKDRFGVVKTRLLTKDYDSRSRIKSHFTQVVKEGGEDSLTEYHVCRVYRRKKWSQILQNLCEIPSCVGEYIMSSSQQNATETASYSKCQSDTIEAEEDKQDTVRHRMWIDPTLTGELTDDEEFSLCKCRIVTGRTHQIRVHMRHIGHPLVSDTKYLEPKKCQEDRQWCPRMFLHAALLEFSDPDSPNTFVEAICPLAHELVHALKTALVCVEDYQTDNMMQYGIPDVPQHTVDTTGTIENKPSKSVKQLDIKHTSTKSNKSSQTKVYKDAKITDHFNEAFLHHVPLPPAIAPPEPFMKTRNTQHVPENGASQNDANSSYSQNDTTIFSNDYSKGDHINLDHMCHVNTSCLHPPTVTPPTPLENRQRHTLSKS